MTDTKPVKFGLLTIQSLGLRLTLLVVLAIPAFNRSLIESIIPQSAGTYFPASLVMTLGFVAYATLVYSVIVWTFGVKGLTQMLSIAIILALTVVLTMAAFSKAPFVGEWLQGSKASTPVDGRAVEQLFTMLVVIPHGMLFIHSFPPAELISRLRSPSGQVSEWVVRIAITLRIYSMVVDAIAAFHAAWSEENPKVLLPRHRKDIGGTDKLWKLPMWFLGAAATWGLALVTYCIEQIPQLVAQLDTTIDQQKKGY